MRPEPEVRIDPGLRRESLTEKPDGQSDVSELRQSVVVARRLPGPQGPLQGVRQGVQGVRAQAAASSVATGDGGVMTVAARRVGSTVIEPGGRPPNPGGRAFWLAVAAAALVLPIAAATGLLGTNG